jgi:hypothetical protein
MPKRNPKHNVKRKHMQIPIRKTPTFLKKDSRSKSHINFAEMKQHLKFAPRLPSNSELKRTQRKHESILFQIEHAIINWMQANVSWQVDDYNVMNALGCLIYTIRLWENNLNLQSSAIKSTTRLDPIELSLFEALFEYAKKFRSQDQLKSVQIKCCFACIYNSAKFWTKQHGSTGYLDYISQFIPSGLSENDLKSLDQVFAKENFGLEDEEDKWDEKEDAWGENYRYEDKAVKSGKNRKEQKRKCSICGKTQKLIKTSCCNHWICDDSENYVMSSYANNSCYRNHDRYTLCSFHHNEGHAGDWKTCPECRKDFETEMYVWYGTNQYNVEKLPNPPKFEPTNCAKCNKIIHLGEENHTRAGSQYYCDKCGGFSGSGDFTV